MPGIDLLSGLSLHYFVVLMDLVFEYMAHLFESLEIVRPSVETD